MFVLPPPPPRYSVPIAYAAGAANGMAVPIIETNNIIRHPEGGCPLQVGEGTYELVDDLHLATPPPHPSEAPVTNPNPLATVPNPPTSGVKVSLVIAGSSQSPPNLYRPGSLTSDLRSIRENEKEGGGPRSDSGSEPWSNISAPAFGESNPALMIAPVKDGLKRRKPKNNIVKSSSSFVSRVITHESSTKRLADRKPEGLFAFANINRAFQWLDLSSQNKEEPLAKILFTKAHMLCHDVNELTKSASHLDVIMGSSAGDIIWYEPISAKYARINKNGAVNNSPVSHISWVPGSENLFLAAHSNGQVVVYDKEKEDALFTPEVEESGGASSSKALQILKSVNSKNQKTNPVAVWKVSNQRINQFAVSPDNRHLAMVLEDGTLRVLDYHKEEITDVFPSYYGGMLCVCWSPDGKYMVTGGQDDLVSIWSLAERKIIARCQGHHSWVSAVAFDPWRCDERNYRFGSVGDDCRLLLWDFNVGMLHRPKALQTNGRHRNSVTVGIHQLSRHRTDSLSNRKRSDSDRTEKPKDSDEEEVLDHPVEPRKLTALLPPIMSKIVGSDPICWLGFQEDSIFTSSLEGHIRTWTRPRENVTNESHANLSLTVSGSGSGGAGESNL